MILRHPELQAVEPSPSSTRDRSAVSSLAGSMLNAVLRTQYFASSPQLKTPSTDIISQRSARFLQAAAFSLSKLRQKDKARKFQRMKRQKKRVGPKLAGLVESRSKDSNTDPYGFLSSNLY